MRAPFSGYSLRVVDQTLDRGPASIAKHEQRPAEGISVEDLAADAGQPVNPFPKILGVDGHQDAHLRGDLDHASMPAMARLSCARSGNPTRCRRMRTVVRCPSTSITQSSVPVELLGLSSTNPDRALAPTVRSAA